MSKKKIPPLPPVPSLIWERPILLAGEGDGEWWGLEVVRAWTAKDVNEWCGCRAPFVLWSADRYTDQVYECLECGATWTPGYES